MKDNKGITLVALVITIIVLLILAGVSISLVVGDNGVLTQAQNASTKTNESSANSAVQLTAVSLSTNFMADDWSEDVNAKIYDCVTIQELEKELENNGYKLKTYTLEKGGSITTPSGDSTHTVDGTLITVPAEGNDDNSANNGEGATFEIYEKSATNPNKATTYKYTLDYNTAKTGLNITPYVAPVPGG